MINLSSVYLFLLVLTRLSAFFMTAPVFSSRGIPAHFKIGFSVFMSLLISPIIGADFNITLNGTYIIHIIQEAMLGLAIGWMAQMIFSSIQVAGQFIDMQIGFSIANVIDPQTGAQSPVMGNFKYTFAVLLFLVLNIHHLFIDTIISSYEILPLYGGWFDQITKEPITLFIMSSFAKMFVLSLKIAAPIVVTLFLTDLALGIVARTVPQLNVFVVGMPLKVLINFLLYTLLVVGFIYIFKEVFQEMIAAIQQFISLMGL